METGATVPTVYVNSEDFFDNVKYKNINTIVKNDSSVKTIRYEQVPTILSGEVKIGSLKTEEEYIKDGEYSVLTKHKIVENSESKLLRRSDENKDEISLKDFPNLKIHKSYLAIASVTKKTTVKVTGKPDRILTNREVYILIDE